MSDTLRDTILASKRNFKRKDVEAFGVKIQIRQLSAGDVKDIAHRQTAADPSIHNNVWWIIGCSFDPETGNRIFDWSDADGLNGLFVGDVNSHAEACLELNSTNKPADEIAKNS